MAKRRARPLSLAAALAALICGLPVLAAGDLDPDFAAGAGYTLLPLGAGPAADDRLNDVLIDPAGRIVVAGFRSDRSGIQETRAMVLARLLPDGGFDPSFGDGGVQAVAFGSAAAAATVLVTADQRYVACGLAENDPGSGVGAFAVARLLEDGALDTSFDFDGRRTLAVQHADGGMDAVRGACAATPSGGMVIVGGVYNSATTHVSLAVARLSADGSLDTTFNGSGYKVFDPVDGQPSIALAFDVHVGADGSMLLAGLAHVDPAPPFNFDMLLVRLLADGTPDPAFGIDGVRTVAFDQGGSNSDIAAALLPLPDGRLLLAGAAAITDTDSDVALARLLADGSLDASFGTGGRALFGYGFGFDSVTGMAVDAGGRLYLAGKVAVATDNADAAVLRVTPGGTLDQSYGDNGWHVFGIDNPLAMDDEFAGAITLDAAERAVVAGYASDDANQSYDGLVLRLTGERLFEDGFEGNH